MSLQLHLQTLDFAGALHVSAPETITETITLTDSTVLVQSESDASITLTESIGIACIFVESDLESLNNVFAETIGNTIVLSDGLVDGYIPGNNVTPTPTPTASGNPGPTDWTNVPGVITTTWTPVQ